MWRLILLAACMSALGQNSATKITLSAAMSGSADTHLYRGWPAILEVVVLLAEGDEALLATQLEWNSSVTVRITGSGGSPVTWPFRQAAATAAPFKLQPLLDASAAWVLSPEDTQALQEGEYSLRVELNTMESAAGDGWKGVVNSPPVRIVVAAEPPVLTTSAEALKAYTQSRWLDLSGDKEAAISVLSAHLDRNPAAMPALIYKAELLDELGRTSEALKMINAAIASVRRLHGDLVHAPRNLLRLQSTLASRLDAEQ